MPPPSSSAVLLGGGGYRSPTDVPAAEGQRDSIPPKGMTDWHVAEVSLGGQGHDRPFLGCRTGQAVTSYEPAPHARCRRGRRHGCAIQARPRDLTLAWPPRAGCRR